MGNLHGFVIIRTEYIDEYQFNATLYKHEGTGAELLSIACPDENKVFGITFRTPPADSTGVAHILEHSVLCGSQKYPVKEPFVELLKGSLQTFLNAFTYPDKTCYPVASQNLQDFYNLIDIYLDAVFYPLLERHTFEQEAWHYELNKPDEPLIYKGVVFNEMKGVYASADNLLEIHSQRALFPDITYGHDYGGDPRHIPELTWEQLIAFHRKYYHPSNARIYFYGDDDPEARLRLMNDYLKAFSMQEIDSAIPKQREDCELPVDIRIPYPANENDEEGLAHVTVNWRLAGHDDPEESMALHLLDHILNETPASPLRKTLIESGLGEDLAGTGLESHIREMFFSIGMKGVKTGDESKVVSLIDKTLRDLVTNGIDPKTIESTINSQEFHFRELNTGNYPRGLSLMVATMPTWLYGGDPLSGIRYRAPLESIRKRLASNEQYFESLVAKWLINNKHRTTVMLYPDAALKNRLDREEAEKLAAIKGTWSEEAIVHAIQHTAQLKERQATPDSPEALRCVPHLVLDDLNQQNAVLPIATTEIDGVPFLFHDLYTQGISYLDVGFNMQTVPDDLLSLTGVWARALLETGTEVEDFVSLTQRIGRLTGGIEPELYCTTITGTEEAQAWAFLRGKSLDAKFPDLLAILNDMINGAQLGNRERIRQIIAEEKAGLESDIIPAGHRFVAQRLRARFNTADWIQEQLGGISYLFSLRALSKEMDQDWESVKAKLFRLHELLTTSGNLMLNLTAAGSSRAKAEQELQAFIGHRRRGSVNTQKRTQKILEGGSPEGLAIPAQVNYVGKGINLRHEGFHIDGHNIVVNRYLRTAWLWDQVRVQGGAYGAFSMLDYRSGQLTMASYRDPNIENTLSVYDRTASYLQNLSIDEDEITRAIVGAIGDIDSHLLPDAKGFISMARHLAGDTDEQLQQIRDQVLNTKLKHFHEYGEKVALLAKRGRIVVMGAREQLAGLKDMTVTPVL